MENSFSFPTHFEKMNSDPETDDSPETYAQDVVAIMTKTHPEEMTKALEDAKANRRLAKKRKRDVQEAEDALPPWMALILDVFEAPRLEIEEYVLLKVPVWHVMNYLPSCRKRWARADSMEVGKKLDGCPESILSHLSKLKVAELLMNSKMADGKRKSNFRFSLERPSTEKRKHATFWLNEEQASEIRKFYDKKEPNHPEEGTVNCLAFGKAEFATFQAWITSKETHIKLTQEFGISELVLDRLGG